MSDLQREFSDILPVYDTIEDDSEEYSTNKNSSRVTTKKDESNNGESETFNNLDEHNESNLLELAPTNNIYWRRNNSKVRSTII